MDKRAITDARHECRAFMVVRDEALRLPYVLNYHRALGVSRFFAIDNVSNDQTLEYLLDQADCHVYRATGSYAVANFGVDWINQLIAWHGKGHWCLSIDADECLVYPDCESVPLPRLCEYLDSTAADGLFSIMLDMYSDRTIAETRYEAGKPFLDACPYFDRDYRFRRRLGRFPTHEFIGGPRLRCFYPEFVGIGILSSNFNKAVHRTRAKLGLTSSAWGVMPPKLIKIPLIRGGAGKWLDSHRTTRLTLGDVTAALLHFKYFSDFHDRVVTACIEGEHYDAGSEYSRYKATLEKNPKLSFFYEGSVRYSRSEDLLRLNFVNACDRYRNLAPNRAAA
jgi:hypothetical protein